jgi:hypothetical protein
MCVENMANVGGHEWKTKVKESGKERKLKVEKKLQTQPSLFQIHVTFIFPHKTLASNDPRTSLLLATSPVIDKYKRFSRRFQH